MSKEKELKFTPIIAMLMLILWVYDAYINGFRMANFIFGLGYVLICIEIGLKLISEGMKNEP